MTMRTRLLTCPKIYWDISSSIFFERMTLKGRHWLLFFLSCANFKHLLPKGKYSVLLLEPVFQWIFARTTKELTASALSAMTFKVVAPPEIVLGMFPSADVDLKGRVRSFQPFHRPHLCLFVNLQFIWRLMSLQGSHVCAMLSQYECFIFFATAPTLYHITVQKDFSHVPWYGKIHARGLVMSNFASSLTWDGDCKTNLVSFRTAVLMP